MGVPRDTGVATASAGYGMICGVHRRECVRVVEPSGRCNARVEATRRGRGTDSARDAVAGNTALDVSERVSLHAYLTPSDQLHSQSSPSPCFVCHEPSPASTTPV
jgi:hypothetical protein